MKKTNQIKQSTKEKYNYIYESHLARFFLESNLSNKEKIPWIDFSKWLIITMESKRISFNYKITIKSAVLYKLKEVATCKQGQIAAEIINTWKVSDQPAVDPGINRRSRKTRRMLPKDDWSAIINYFNINHSRWGARAQNMIAAIVGCGARPIEWIYAQIIGDNKVRLYNAKVKNINALNRVNPNSFYENSYNKANTREKTDRMSEALIQSTRLNINEDSRYLLDIQNNTIDLGNRVFRDVVFDSDFKVPISFTIRYVDNFFKNKFGSDWRVKIDSDTLERVFKDEFYSKVRIAIWRACKQLFGEEKLYSAADARSTFAANRKAQLGIAQTAVDMGHSGTSMTRNKYAPARKAWKDPEKDRKLNQAPMPRDYPGKAQR